MPEVNVNVEVYCAHCGNRLCNQTEFIRGRGGGDPQLRVEPCETCLDVARDVSYDEGYDDATQAAEAAEGKGET